LEDEYGYPLDEEVGEGISRVMCHRPGPLPPFDCAQGARIGRRGNLGH
jgi:hypothetical protein